MTSKKVRRGTAFGSVRPPGSKSVTNRAFVAAALSRSTSSVEGGLDADDTQVMAECLRALGVKITGPLESVVIEGSRSFPSAKLDVGASGTTMRFLTGLAGVIEAVTELDGTKRMRERPIASLVDGLVSLGASVEYLQEARYPPLRVHGASAWSGDISLDASESSQFVSALMLAAPFHGLGLEITYKGGAATSATYLTTTAEVMSAFGVDTSLSTSGVIVHPGNYKATRFEVEPDASAAVFMWGAAALTGGSVGVQGISHEVSTQADLGALAVLEQMGCSISVNEMEIRVSGPSRLTGVKANLSLCPDSALMLAVCAATASTPSILTGLHTLRLKETDRLAALESELRKVGCEVTTTNDSIVIVPSLLRAASVETYDDHRMAMSFGVLGLVVDGLEILDPGCVSKTWPDFWTVLEGINRNIVVAIDGHAGVGKTSVSQAVADSLGFTRLDTGALYRAVTVVGLERSIDLSHEAALLTALDEDIISFGSGHIFLGDRDICKEIRTDSVSQNVSEVSAHPKVRERMVSYQRQWVEAQDVGVVAEGRDMGTVVFPNAKVKVFLNARPEIRAARRAGELTTDIRKVAADMAERDRKDSTRETSPTRRAHDAVEIDTSDISIEQVVAKVVELTKQTKS